MTNHDISESSRLEWIGEERGIQPLLPSRYEFDKRGGWHSRREVDDVGRADIVSRKTNTNACKSRTYRSELLGHEIIANHRNTAPPEVCC